MGRRVLCIIGGFLVAGCLIAFVFFNQGPAASGDTESADNAPAVDTSAFEWKLDDPLYVEEKPETISKYDGLSAAQIWDLLNVTVDFRDGFNHGEKGSEYQKYIMLHDTEGDGAASAVVDWWASNGNLTASHFIINQDGSIIQCVPLDSIAHHAGYGDAGHNDQFGVIEDGRDDMNGTMPIGDWATDYGMNAYSVGIELVHMAGDGDYTEEQLVALDNLIAYIDAYYGFESEIIDHKEWRSGNSDTSEEFSRYLANYKATRTHDGS